jgi:hypothetical protein
LREFAEQPLRGNERDGRGNCLLEREKERDRDSPLGEWEAAHAMKKRETKTERGLATQRETEDSG